MKATHHNHILVHSVSIGPFHYTRLAIAYSGASTAVSY